MEREDWERNVRAAIARDDHPTLQSLFRAAVAAWGRDAASRAWQEVFGEFDANAQTG